MRPRAGRATDSGRDRSRRAPPARRPPAGVARPRQEIEPALRPWAPESDRAAGDRPPGTSGRPAPCRDTTRWRPWPRGSDSPCRLRFARYGPDPAQRSGQGRPEWPRRLSGRRRPGARNAREACEEFGPALVAPAAGSSCLPVNITTLIWRLPVRCLSFTNGSCLTDTKCRPNRAIGAVLVAKRVCGARNRAQGTLRRPLSAPFGQFRVSRTRGWAGGPSRGGARHRTASRLCEARGREPAGADGGGAQPTGRHAPSPRRGALRGRGRVR
jgi:hypothetical protein